MVLVLTSVSATNATIAGHAHGTCSSHKGKLSQVLHVPVLKSESGESVRNIAAESKIPCGFRHTRSDITRMSANPRAPPPPPPLHDVGVENILVETLNTVAYHCKGVPNWEIFDTL